MTTRNYDTTNGQPFVYFDLGPCNVDPVTGVSTVTFLERMAIKSADGATHFLDTPQQQHSFALLPADMPKEFDLVDRATGHHLPQRVSYAFAMQCLFSAIRAKQEELDQIEAHG